jgi:2-pyrone-4,6-dicarboxylate lactonase
VRINLLRQDGKPVSSERHEAYDDLLALAPRLNARGTGTCPALGRDRRPGWSWRRPLEKLPLTYRDRPHGPHHGRQGRRLCRASAGFCERLKTGRYWCKLSGRRPQYPRQGAPYADTAPFMKALVAANPDRLVWGSDWPHVGHADATIPRMSDLLDLFFECVPDEKIRRKILVDNAASLYGF